MKELWEDLKYAWDAGFGWVLFGFLLVMAFIIALRIWVITE